jgi:peptidoglycan/xylan/chitin deacetylase (PgdA/CDA1 family)
MPAGRRFPLHIALLILVVGNAAPATAQMPERGDPWFMEGDVSCGRIALIFNIGMSSNAGETPSDAILHTLIDAMVDATMFPMGEFARAHPEYLQRLNTAGFEIGTHGDVAISLTQASDEAIREDIRTSIDAIEAVIGRPIDPYHTPYAADTDMRVRDVIGSEGLVPIGWKVSAPDWSEGASEEAVYRAVVDHVYPGAIVEMHLDGSATERSKARALPRIIADLRDRGYEFVTIGDMLEPCPGPAIDLPGTVTMTGLDVHGLHCMSAPGRGARMLRVLFTGDTVPVRGPIFDGWLPVKCAGQDGWIKADAVPGIGNPSG